MDHNFYSRDAMQANYSFVLAQQTLIEPEVYKIQYPDLPYATLIPVDTSAPEWVSSVTYFSQDSVGKAQWYAGGAQDVPRVELKREKFDLQVKMVAIGYGYNIEEIGKARLMRMNLEADKAAAARRAHYEFTNNVAFVGDLTVNFRGISNQTTVTATTAPADGTGSATTAASKTPLQILRDLNGQVQGIYVSSNTVEMADVVLMPIALKMLLESTPMSSTNSDTVMEVFRRTNPYTSQTGRQLTIRSILGLETAGAGSISRTIFYRKDPQVLKMHMPMPFRFLPVWQDGPTSFEVPGIFRLGGTDVKRPGAMRYLDGL